MQCELFADAATSPAHRVPCLWKEREKKKNFKRMHLNKHTHKKNLAEVEFMIGNR